jgi:hypothetical protein
MTKQEAIDALVVAAEFVVIEYHREFDRGELEDVDRLEDAIAAYRSAAEPSAVIEFADCEECGGSKFVEGPEVSHGWHKPEPCPVCSPAKPTCEHETQSTAGNANAFVTICLDCGKQLRIEHKPMPDEDSTAVRTNDEQ